MDRKEIREFLMTHRARRSPEEAGFPHGADRRVPGLRRGEAAQLAGVSVEYYGRLERGELVTASESVLEGLARALALTAPERDHLFHLAGRPAPPAPAELRWGPSQGLRWTLDSMTESAALVGNGRTDLLAWNDLGGALMGDMIAAAGGRPNFSRYLFQEPGARDFYTDCDEVARVNVAQLRTELGRDPKSPGLRALIDELRASSSAFRELWQGQDVWRHDSGIKHYRHATVGELSLHFTGLDVVGHPSVQLTVLTAEPGTESAARLRQLRDGVSPVATP